VISFSNLVNFKILEWQPWDNYFNKIIYRKG